MIKLLRGENYEPTIVYSIKLSFKNKSEKNCLLPIIFHRGNKKYIRKKENDVNAAKREV